MTGTPDRTEDDLIRRAADGDESRLAELFGRHREAAAADGPPAARPPAPGPGRPLRRPPGGLPRRRAGGSPSTLAEPDDAVLPLAPAGHRPAADATCTATTSGPQMRDAGREVSLYRGALPAGQLGLAGGAAAGPAHLAASQAAVRAELQLRLQEALNGMDPIDREVLALRHFEELSNAEAAAGARPEQDGGQQPLRPGPEAAQGDPGRHPRPARRVEAEDRPTSARRPTMPRPTSSSDHDPVERAGRGVPRPAPPRRAARRSTSTPAATPSWPSEIRELFPALVLMEQLKPGAERPDRQRRRRAAAPAAARARAAGRLPHPPRGRPRRHGRRLRGRAGVARPPRGAEGPARPRPARPAAAARGSSREARAAARLHHTNIVPVFGVGEHDGRALLRHAVHPGPGPRRRCSRSCGGSAAGGRSRRPPRPGGAAGAASATDVAAVAADRPVRPADAGSTAASERRPPTRRRATGRGAAGTAVRRPIAARPVRPLVGRPTRGAGYCPERGPDRRAGGRGAGVRPRARACSTATSSRRTSCSTPTARSGSPTSAWPRRPTTTT